MCATISSSPVAHPLLLFRVRSFQFTKSGRSAIRSDQDKRRESARIGPPGPSVAWHWHSNTLDHDAMAVTYLHRRCLRCPCGCPCQVGHRISAVFVNVLLCIRGRDSVSFANQNNRAEEIKANHLLKSRRGFRCQNSPSSPAPPPRRSPCTSPSPP